MILIYLDLNKWVELANYFYQDKEDWKKIITNIRSQNDIIFPISSSHVVEIRKRKDLVSRGKLARVMAKLSNAYFLVSNVDLRPYELKLAICKTFGITPLPEKPQIIGRGIYFAFGMEEQYLFSNNDSEYIKKEKRNYLESPQIISQILKGSEEFEDLNFHGLKKYEEALQKMVDDEEDLRNRGLEYSKAIRFRSKSAQFFFRYEEELIKALANYNLTIKDLVNKDKKQRYDFFKKAPTFNVELILSTQRNEHKDRDIEINDVIDIDFLSRAIPHCDVVVTEKFWVSLAKRKKLGEKYSTHITSDLTDIKKFI